MIEVLPVLVLNIAERKAVEKTMLSDYVFNWGEKWDTACLALGFLSLYNHDYSANCSYEMDFENKLMGIKTVRRIKKGEELCINYNGDPESKTKVWFHEQIKEV